jgi:hypothetical protein
MVLKQVAQSRTKQEIADELNVHVPANVNVLQSVFALNSVYERLPVMMDERYRTLPIVMTIELDIRRELLRRLRQ